MSRSASGRDFGAGHLTAGRRFLGLAVLAAMLLPLGQLTGWCAARGPAIAPRPILVYAGSPWQRKRCCLSARSHASHPDTCGTKQSVGLIH